MAEPCPGGCDTHDEYMYCDPTGGQCLPCNELCNRARGTLMECQSWCKEYYAESQITSSAPTALPLQSDGHSRYFSIVIPVALGVIVTMIIAFMFYKRRSRPRPDTEMAIHDPVQEEGTPPLSITNSPELPQRSPPLTPIPTDDENNRFAQAFQCMRMRTEEGVEPQPLQEEVELQPLQPSTMEEEEEEEEEEASTMLRE